MNSPGRSVFGLRGPYGARNGGGLGVLRYHSVVALDRQGATLVAAGGPARSEGLRQIVAAAADALGEGEVEQAAGRILQGHGPIIDIVVHHAGVTLRPEALQTSLPDWQRALVINLTGTWLTGRAATRGMIQRGDGRIVITISCLCAQIAGPFSEPAYYSADGGVAIVSCGLVAAWGRHGVTGKRLGREGLFPTPTIRAVTDDPGLLEEMARRTLVGRLGDPPSGLAGVARRINPRRPALVLLGRADAVLLMAADTWSSACRMMRRTVIVATEWRGLATTGARAASSRGHSRCAFLLSWSPSPASFRSRSDRGALRRRRCRRLCALEASSEPSSPRRGRRTRRLTPTGRETTVVGSWATIHARPRPLTFTSASCARPMSLVVAR